MTTLALIPLDLDEANAYVDRLHRHHPPVVGHKFSLGCALFDEVIGVAIVGRPVSRALDDGMTLEVTRLCTDGKDSHPIGRTNRKGEPMFYNAASFLWGACRRAAFALGYRRLGTYILKAEGGGKPSGRELARRRRRHRPLLELPVATARRQASDARQAAARGA